MKISQTITERKLIETELDCPAFFKSKDGEVLAIYSEDRTVKVSSPYMGDDFCIIIQCKFSIVNSAEDFLNGEPITEAEFNAALSEAIMKISGVEVAKEVAA